MENFDLSKALKKIDVPCDWLGVRRYRQETTFTLARNGKSGENSSRIQDGLMIEALVNGQLAYAATSELSLEGLKKIAAKAAKLAQSASAFALHKFDPSIRSKQVGKYNSPRQVPIREIPLGEIHQRLIKLTKALNPHQDKRILETQAYAMLTKTQIDYACSLGSEWQQDFEIISRDMSATAQEGPVVQNRSLGLIGRQWGLEALDLETLNPEAERISKQVIELLSAEECPEEKCEVILMPDQLYLQVHESIGHPLELDRILGDERNYAGWSFVSPQDFGVLRWGPEILNVSFDPTLPGEMASYEFDDCGQRAEKQLLIEKGILKRGIGGIESQKRSNIPGVSCSRATSWNRAPIDRMGNINIEPGESSLDEMISSTKRGVLMHTNRSWSIDDYRNKFQFGCEYAELIEDGKITKTLRNPNYRGETVPFWNNLTHIGNPSTFEVWGSPYCGKGEPNQVIRVGHAIPACKFKEIEVFGGAS